MRLASRDECEGFAERTRMNFEHIERVKIEGRTDVHVVTQLANSLFGLIVFPWEKEVKKRIEEIKLGAPGWPRWAEWEDLEGDCLTLDRLVKHLRNAIAHGRILFKSDSPDLDEVVFEFEDRNTKTDQLVWHARIKGTELREFCLQFVTEIVNTVG
jgi:hypothetical protein